ncbi:hypothetical protein D3C85_1322450 [compost metagenome]
MASAGAFSMVTCSPRAKIGSCGARTRATRISSTMSCNSSWFSPAPSAATRMQARPWWVEATMRPSAELAVDRMVKPSCSSSWAMLRTRSPATVSALISRWTMRMGNLSSLYIVAP